MSLILDALNKADNERNKDNEAPTIGASHGAPSNSRTTKRIDNKYLVLLAIFLLPFCVGGAYWLGRGNSEIESTQITQEKQRLARDSQATDKPSLTERPSAPQKDTRKKNEQKYEALKQRLIEAQYKRAEQDNTNQNTVKKTTVNDTSEKQATKQAPNEQAKKDAQVEASKVAAIYQNIDKSSAAKKEKGKAPKAAPTNSDTLASYAAIGSIRDLPYSMQEKIPTILYSEHQYSARNASVTLNSSKRKRGSQVAPDIYIDRILKDGVILRYKQEKFKMRALSSWVNM